MRYFAVTALGAWVLLASVPGAFANCAADDPDGSKTLAARQQVATDCTCDHGSPATVNHGQYVHCAAAVAKTRSSLDPSDPSFLPDRAALLHRAARSSTSRSRTSSTHTRPWAPGREDDSSSQKSPGSEAPTGATDRRRQASLPFLAMLQPKVACMPFSNWYEACSKRRRVPPTPPRGRSRPRRRDPGGLPRARHSAHRGSPAGARHSRAGVYAHAPRHAQGREDPRRHCGGDVQRAPRPHQGRRGNAGRRKCPVPSGPVAATGASPWTGRAGPGVRRPGRRRLSKPASQVRPRPAPLAPLFTACVSSCAEGSSDICASPSDFR